MWRRAATLYTYALGGPVSCLANGDVKLDQELDMLRKTMLTGGRRAGSSTLQLYLRPSQGSAVACLACLPGGARPRSRVGTREAA